MAAARDKAEPIAITMPDGAERKGVRGVTTPLDVANEISKSLAKNSVVAKVNGEIWDLFRPLEKDCRLELFPFDTPEGQEVRLRSPLSCVSTLCLAVALYVWRWRRKRFASDPQSPTMIRLIIEVR